LGSTVSQFGIRVNKFGISGQSIWDLGGVNLGSRAVNLGSLYIPCFSFFQEMNSQVADIESDFKVTTKKAQSLVKESSPEIVTDMLQSLNIQKEVLVRLRKEIPECSKHLTSVLPNVASLETGIIDLDKWLTVGEELLDTHRLDGSHEETEQRLEKHKVGCSTLCKPV